MTMTRIMKHALTACALCALVAGCAAVQPIPPAGCEESLLWQNKTTVDAIFTAAVIGARVTAQYCPEEYRMAQASAEVAVSLLERKQVAFSEIREIPGWVSGVVNPLLSILSPDQYLHPCDKQLLIDYLRML